jgi:hypothetical protein
MLIERILNFFSKADEMEVIELEALGLEVVE